MGSIQDKALHQIWLSLIYRKTELPAFFFLVSASAASGRSLHLVPHYEKIELIPAAQTWLDVHEFFWSVDEILGSQIIINGQLSETYLLIHRTGQSLLFPVLDCFLAGVIHHIEATNIAHVRPFSAAIKPPDGAIAHSFVPTTLFLAALC